MGRITSSVIRKAAVGAAAFSAFVGVALPAEAQFSQSYVDTTTGTLSDTATPCNNALIRTINIPDNVTITDVDLGMIIDHNNRGDTAAALRHPDGTQVLLYFATGGTSNDYNVRFDQAAANAVDATAPQSGNNNTLIPPYQYTVRPSGTNTLNDFNGKNAQGDWMFLACDNTANGVNGNYLRSEIFITGTQDFADLALDISTPDTSPDFGSFIDITLTATHEEGALTATGVTADYDLPSGLSFQGASGDGTYNDTTGIWTIGTLAPSGSASITIIVEVLSSGAHNSIGEIITSSQTDPDSTPNNAGGNPAEDDTDALTLTPASTAGTGPGGEPILSCPTPQIFDWDVNPWVYDSSVLSRTYPTGGSDNTPFTVSFTGNTNRRGPAGANQSPERNTDMTGGIVPVEQSLYYWQNLQSPAESVDLTVDIGTPGVGVQDLQFLFFDVDFSSGQFRDKYSVTGFLNGIAVSPVLTSGSANSSIGNVVVGTAANDNAQAGGNVFVTFLSPVDQVVLNYSNPEASTGTSNQAMGLHDLNYCPRTTDFGDISTGYGTPSHRVRNGYRIGATAPDGEAATQVSPNADGDDLAGADDEDPIDFSELIAGITSDVDVDVTGSGGFLQMWIDWNGDGDFNDTVDGQSEQVATNSSIAGTTGTITVSVNVPASATLSQTNARLRWSTQSGLGVSGLATDGEVEDHSFTIGGAASLTGSKTNAVYDPAAVGLYALPGNDVIYTITVANAGTGPTDTDSVLLIDKIPDEVEFWNGDIDDGGPDTFTGTDPVGFTQANGAALTFDYAADVAFATGATPPADFAACSAVAADSTYRSDLTFICFNPKGQLASGDPDPEFSVSFRARIK